MVWRSRRPTDDRIGTFNEPFDTLTETWASTSLRRVTESHDSEPVCRKAGRASTLVRVRRGARQPDLIVAYVVGDDETETGALGPTKPAASI